MGLKAFLSGLCLPGKRQNLQPTTLVYNIYTINTLCMAREIASMWDK